MKILLDDVKLTFKPSETTHNHSIVAIRNSFEEFPNRFLVYYDTRWECFLFLNFKTNVNNESFIINGLSHQLKTDRSAYIATVYIQRN